MYCHEESATLLIVKIFLHRFHLLALAKELEFLAYLSWTYSKDMRGGNGNLLRIRGVLLNKLRIMQDILTLLCMEVIWDLQNISN